ncbi:VWA domain-containing protein [uncultured Cellulomonas sp.]|uniref:VWA domain-containing protein n=1 Tax=uncultured Cellulomonas sp. TaxID=189682 RepID=UPI0028EBFF0B|nr:VWA domain-containing protein [uncultured Cellulomonas sp.]
MTAALHRLGATCLAVMIASWSFAASRTAAEPAHPHLPAALVTGTSSSLVGDPLLVVVDLSGSMNETASGGADGVSKLDAAKTALRTVVHQQPPGSQIGLWTYPSGGDCGAGGYVPAGKIGAATDTAALEAQINALQADGNTPTASALAAAVASVKAQGINSANVLLVSDGESNCEGDPCAAAKSIVEQGFHVTVQAMGFDISAAGRTELSCIANATGGTYYDVADGTQLNKLMGDIAIGRLRADVTASSPVVGGVVGRVGVTVTNPSAQTATDVTVALSFVDRGEGSVFPPAIPPTYRLGNIPPGASVHREWTFSTAAHTLGTANWKVTTTAPKLGSVTNTGTVTIVAKNLTLADGGPVLNRVGDGKVVILGDSYSAGEGTRDYLPLANAKQTSCHRSNQTYAVALYGTDNVANFACSGAVLADFTNRSDGKDQPSQLEQMTTTLQDHPSLVLMTMAGNDIHFGDLIRRCVYSGFQPFGVPVVDPTNDCVTDLAFVMEVAGYIEALHEVVPLFSGSEETRPKLELAYEQVWDAVNPSTRTGSPAAVIVLAYPQVLPQWQRASCTGFTANEVQFGNKVVVALNAEVKRAVDALAAKGKSIYFAAPVQDAVLPDHTACSADPFIQPVTASGGYLRGVDDAVKKTETTQELMHPTVAGYTAETNALVSWSKKVTTIEGKVSSAGPYVQAKSPPSAPKATLGPKSVLSPLRVGSGTALDLTVHGAAPLSPLTVTVHSTAQVLAVLESDQDGVARNVVYLPANLPPGRHTIEASGVGVDGKTFTYSRPLLVSPRAPAWLAFAWVGAGLAASGALLLVAFVRLRRRGLD